MPLGEPEPGDPTLLVGVEVEGDADSVREMAYTFAEEYALLGHSEQQILRLFHHPSYAGPSEALARLGEVEVRRIVRECAQAYGRVRFVVRDAPSADERLVSIGLPPRRRGGPAGVKEE